MTTKIPTELQAEAQKLVCTPKDNPNPVLKPDRDSEQSEQPPNPFSPFSQFLGLSPKDIGSITKYFGSGPRGQMAPPKGAPPRPFFMWSRPPVPIR